MPPCQCVRSLQARRRALRAGPSCSCCHSTCAAGSSLFCCESIPLHARVLHDCCTTFRTKLGACMLLDISCPNR